MPRNKEQNEEIRRERSDAIIRAALKVYVEKGYAAAEIGDVANEAGVARGLVYYYFKDKRELFREMFLFMFNRSKRHVKAHFENGIGPVRESFESFARSMFYSVLERTESVLFFFRMRQDLHVLFDPEETKSLAWHVEYMQVIRNSMAKGIEAGEIRDMNPHLLSSLFWGTVMHGMMHLRQTKLELEEQGIQTEKIEEMLKRDMEDALACSMSLITAGSRV